jgi:hypothetical protein
MENLNKNQNHYKLFIDELGTASTKDTKSELYILAGCSVNEAERHNVKNWADHIKFKYWGHTNIVFHSREIGRKENDFRILRNKETLEEFLKDLEQFLLCSKFKMFFVIVDKEKIRKMGWNDIKIYQETSASIVMNFLLILLSSDSTGKIIIESATAEKDFYFHKALGHFLAEGLKELKVNHKRVQEAITSISFVTKNNYDIEEQISDLFAYAAKCKYLKKKRSACKSGEYEKMILRLLERKLFKVPRDAKANKMKYFNEVDSFFVLPV